MTLPRPSETLGYLRWIFDRRRRPSVAQIYELLSTTAISREGLYLNLGYWADADDVDAACAALVDLMADTAGIGPSDTVLDVGFGFGDQDIRWMQRYAPDRIVGVNITGSQVREARRRVAAAGMGERIRLLQGSATALPLPARSVDKVLALECAFHFDTRARFLDEAARVLRPGGRLVVGDIIRAPMAATAPERAWQDWSWRRFAETWRIPRANADSRASYVKKLVDAGFENPRVVSIRHDVFAPLHRDLAADPARLGGLNPVARAPARLALAADPRWLYAALDYVLVSADKPA